MQERFQFFKHASFDTGQNGNPEQNGNLSQALSNLCGLMDTIPWYPQCLRLVDGQQSIKIEQIITRSEHSSSLHLVHGTYSLRAQRKRDETGEDLTLTENGSISKFRKQRNPWSEYTPFASQNSPVLPHIERSVQTATERLVRLTEAYKKNIYEITPPILSLYTLTQERKLQRPVHFFHCGKQYHLENLPNHTFSITRPQLANNKNQIGHINIEVTPTGISLYSNIERLHKQLKELGFFILYETTSDGIIIQGVQSTISNKDKTHPIEIHLLPHITALLSAAIEQYPRTFLRHMKEYFQNLISDDSGV